MDRKADVAASRKGGPGDRDVARAGVKLETPAVRP